MSRILVTGANGQLGHCLKWVVNSDKNKNKENEFIFVSRDDLDVSNEDSLKAFFSKNKVDYIINCAAYTNVDGSKGDIDGVTVGNVIAPTLLAEFAEMQDAVLVHISTDYVFDGKKNTPYTEDDKPNPLNTYGASKLIGETFVLNYSKGYVFRTSWLYSIYGKNFLLTMVNRIKNNKKTEVVIDQVGTPTSARALAMFLVWFVDNCETKKIEPGLYNFSNDGVCSWYDFASVIEDKLKKERYGMGMLHCSEIISPINTDEYNNKNNLNNEPRPAYSVLSNEKIKKYYPYINHWIVDLNNEVFFLGANGFLY
jgi:dTDP-4-dehydrorhamnose reductase